MKRVSIIILLVILVLSNLSFVSADSQNLTKIEGPDTDQSAILFYLNQNRGLENGLVPREISAQDIQHTNFIDVPLKAWYYQSVMAAKEAGLINGDSNNKYYPDKKVSYIEYIKALVNIFYTDHEAMGDSGKEKTVEKYINKAKEMDMFYKKYADSETDNEEYRINDMRYLSYRQPDGYVTSGPDYIENPDSEISREEVFIFACNVLGIKGDRWEYWQVKKQTFETFNDLLIWSRDAYYWTPNEHYAYGAYVNYLTDGLGWTKDNFKTYGYNQPVTKAQLADILLRVKDYAKDPTEFKEERAAIRDALDKAYYRSMLQKIPGYREGDEEKYIVRNGYKVPIDCDVVGGYIHIDLWVRADMEAPEEYNMCQNIIQSKFGADIAKKVVDYGRKKVGEWVNKLDKNGKCI